MRLNTLALASLATSATAQGILEALQSQPELSNLTAYLSLYPSFLAQVQNLTNITLLAPSNEAFITALNSDAGIAGNNDLVTAVFSYHVLEGIYENFSSIPAFVPTYLMPGEYANVTGGQVVEAVSYSDDPNSTTSIFSGYYQNSTLIDVLTPLNASNTTNLTSTMSTTTFEGGVIHVIDRFLTIPDNITDTAIQLNLQSAVGAFQVSSLTEAIGSMMDVTYFIPDNAAFQAVGAAIATSTPEELTNILEYHVVNSSVLYSTMLEGNTTLTAMNGINLDISVEDGEIFVNSARVITPDVLVANGVVHVIDGVLNPGNRTAVPVASASVQSPAFSDAASATEVPFTSGVATATTTINTDGPSIAVSSAEASASSSSSGGAMPRQTGAMAAAALFGGAAALMNM